MEKQKKAQEKDFQKKESSFSDKGKNDSAGSHNPRDGNKKATSTKVHSEWAADSAEPGQKMNTESKRESSQRADKTQEEDNPFYEERRESDYHKRDTYHQTDEKKKNRKHKMQREFHSRERTKEQFDGSTVNDFMKDTGSGEDFKGSKKLQRMGKSVDKAREKTAKARKKIQKNEYQLQKVYDEKTGQSKYVLATVKKNKTEGKRNMLKKTYYRTEGAVRNFSHNKIAEHEKDNSGVEAAHKTEQKIEEVALFVGRNQKSRLQKNRAKVAKLEKKQFKKEVNFRYQKFLEENPEMNEKTLKKAMQRKFQKKRIQREYAKAARAAKAGKVAKNATVEMQNLATAISKKLAELASKYGYIIAIAGVVLILLIMIMTSVSSCGAMFSNGVGTVMSSSYQSVPAEIDATALKMSEYEAALQLQINNIETDYPGYDEYNYDLGEIGYNDFTLISYLSAVHTDFTAAGVETEIESLFNEMYDLTITPTEETRTRTVTKTGTRTVVDPVTGAETEEEYEYEEEEEYTVTILNVKLTVTPLETIVDGKMTADQKGLYGALQESHGLIQRFYSPLDLYWYNYIVHGYGYMVDPSSGTVVFNRGVDISVPAGTNVYASMDGTVTEAAYNDTFGNYIVIEDSMGYCTKYAHLESMSVSVGSTVKHGHLIGKTGATGSCTGSELHIECLYNGEYYNPLFYFDAGEATLYGEGNAGNAAQGSVTPPASYDDATVAALMAEADKYVGMPYVWGGSNPSTSFDCSGFVCYVFKNSGTYPLERTTAQGIYNQCTPVAASEAKAGDIIFFTGTYNSGSAVSHVGIYCGNGIMVHAGDPIKYSSINTSYWQSHFYAFGRLN